MLLATSEFKEEEEEKIKILQTAGRNSMLQEEESRVGREGSVARWVVLQPFLAMNCLSLELYLLNRLPVGLPLGLVYFRDLATLAEKTHTCVCPGKQAGRGGRERGVKLLFM